MPPNVYVSPLPSLPHPEFDISLLLIIEEGLRKAWEILRTIVIPNFDLQTASEDKTTQRFYQIICDEVLKKGLVDGFISDLFRVIREPKQCNHDFTLTDKMPDLRIDYIQRAKYVEYPSEDGLFVECKPVDSAHASGGAYCDKGLIRFIRGEYAWTMAQAMMIGYTRKGYTILPKLYDALQERSKSDHAHHIPTSQLPLQCINARYDDKSWCEPVYVAKHKRIFSFHETGEAAPAITLRHLWLKRD